MASYQISMNILDQQEGDNEHSVEFRTPDDGDDLSFSLTINLPREMLLITTNQNEMYTGRALDLCFSITPTQLRQMADELEAKIKKLDADA